MVGRTALLFTLAALVSPSVAAWASPQPGDASAVSTISRRATNNPLVDHHQHLLGPTALPPLEPLLPRVEVPAELQALLAERARIYGNVRSPSDLAIYAD